jgi:hypothetical protein
VQAEAEFGGCRQDLDAERLVVRLEVRQRVDRRNTSSAASSGALNVSNRRTADGLAVRPVSSDSSRTAACCQVSSTSMKPPGKANRSRAGGMPRRTTSRPEPTGWSATATGLGLR